MRKLLTMLALTGCFFVNGQSNAPVQPSPPVKSTSSAHPSSMTYVTTRPFVLAPYGFAGTPFGFAGEPFDFLGMPFGYNPGNPAQKWQLRPFAGVSAGYTFIPGNGPFSGGTTYLAVPLGAALLHPLNKNLTAFGALSATPMVFSANQFISPGNYSSYPGGIFSKSYTPGLNARLEGGLIYTNDDKTFSISGRVSVERNTYPAYSPVRTNTKNY